VRKLEPLQLPSWAWPLIVIALIAPTIAAFALAGPSAGLAVGALAGAAIIVIAARSRFDEEIEVGASRGDRYMLLVVILAAVEDPGMAGAIAEIGRAGAGATGADPDELQVLLLAPALNTRIAHWLSDLRKARQDAQRRLAVSLGTLAAAGADARGQVGDSDAVQAVEDALRTFPAQEAVFVTGPGHEDEVEEVRRRLDRPVRVLEAGRGAQRGGVDREEPTFRSRGDRP
jgi:hypothetical protein